MADDETNPPQANNRALPPAWALLTLQNVALLVFTGLALVIATIALHIVFFSSRMGNQHTVARLLELLVLSTVFCAFFAWINPANTQLLGRGIKHMLSVHRAAIGSFIIASTATVGMLFYIVLAAASSAELQHGLYLLAAIEFLLKLTAVSAIIVLITLRRAPVFVPARQTPEINNGAPPVVIDEPDDRGRLEFGSLAFAFGLVVIAGLVVPTEDLMRLTNFFFGSDKEIDDYLPPRTLVTVEEDLSEQIAQAVLVSPGIQSMIDASGSDETTIGEELRRLTDKLVANAVIDGVQTIGAYPLLRAICEQKQDDFIFPNSDDRRLAEHLSYLLTAGLVEYPYGDLRTIKMTSYGDEIMLVERLQCGGDWLPPSDRDTIVTETGMRGPNTIDTAQNYDTVSQVPYEEVVTTSGLGTVRKLSLSPGRYNINLQSIGPSDPLVELYDGNGQFVDMDDDSGTQGYDALLSFSVAGEEKYFVKALNFGGGNASSTLRVTAYGNTIAINTSRDVLGRVSAIPLRPAATIPAEGAVFAFAAVDSGQHTILVTLPDGNDGEHDLVASLFRESSGDFELVTEDDDSGPEGMPIITAQFEAGARYALVVRHFGTQDAIAVMANILITPRVNPDGQDEKAQGDVEGERPAPGIEDAPPPPTDSDGSQPDPSLPQDPPA